MEGLDRLASTEAIMYLPSMEGLDRPALPSMEGLDNLWNSGLCLFVCFFGCFILILFSFLFASPMWVFSVQVVNEVLGQELNRKLDRVSKHVNFTETVPRCTCQRGIGDVRVTVHMAPSCDVRVTVHGAPKL